MDFILIIKLVAIGFFGYALYNTYVPKKVKKIVKGYVKKGKSFCMKYVDKVKGWFGK